MIIHKNQTNKALSLIYKESIAKENLSKSIAFLHEKQQIAESIEKKLQPKCINLLA